MTFGRVSVRPTAGAWHHAHDGNALAVLLIGQRFAKPSEITVSVGHQFARRAAYASDGCDRSTWQFVIPALAAGPVTIAIEAARADLVDGAAVSLKGVDPQQPVLLTQIERRAPGATVCRSRAIPSGGARTLVIENGESGGLPAGVTQGTQLARDERHGQWVVAADVTRDVAEIVTERQKNPFDAPLVHVNVTYRPVSG